jgi:TldD protein
MTFPAPFHELDPQVMERTLGTALSEGARFAEIFIENRVYRTLQWQEGRIRFATSSAESGAGIRALAGDGTGYAYTSHPTPPSLAEAATAAARIAAGGGLRGGPIAPQGPAAGGTRPRGEGVLALSGDLRDRAAYLADLDAMARGADPRVKEVTASVGEEARTIHVASTAGSQSTDHQHLTSVRITAYVQDGKETQKGQYGGGGREPLESLAAGRLGPGPVAREAVRRALVLLQAVEAPTGEMPVVIGNGWGGVLLHEAVGHGFEADFVRRGTSIFAGRLGEKVATPLCTVLDDPTVPGLRGSYRIDDEGTPAARTPLIEEGILTGYLHDLLSSDALRMAPTGNGRRQSFRTPPLPRQSNLFLQPGDETAEEILRSVSRGIYAKGLGGGQVDIVNGNFVFEVTEGYLIEEGRVTSPVRGANLIGSGREVLNRISRVGSDFSFDPGTGTCGKDGQSQPVGVGQPTVLVAGMTIGGTRL